MTEAVVGDLYIYCPDTLCNELRPQVDRLYPGIRSLEFSSDGQTIFDLCEVPYPVEQMRQAIVNLCQSSWQSGFTMYWVWIPPFDAEPFPGGTVSVRCPGSESARVLAEMQHLYPGAYVYPYSLEDGDVIYDVDAPYPDEKMHAQLMALFRSTSASWFWRPWFDRVRLPDGNIVFALEV